MAFSFALRAPSNEPNPSNVALARATLAVLRDLPAAFVVAQWEVARALDQLGRPADEVIEQPEDGTYLDTAGVMESAAPLLRRHGIATVTVVAKPGLHLVRARSLVRRYGFAPRRARIEPVPYDRSGLNTQWWTRGRVRLFIYSVGQLAGRWRLVQHALRRQ